MKTDTVVIRIRYENGVAQTLNANYWPKDGIADLEEAMRATTPKQASALFPDTCTIEYYYDPISATMTCALVEDATQQELN